MNITLLFFIVCLTFYMQFCDCISVEYFEKDKIDSFNDEEAATLVPEAIPDVQSRDYSSYPDDMLPSPEDYKPMPSEALYKNLTTKSYILQPVATTKPKLFKSYDDDEAFLDADDYGEEIRSDRRGMNNLQYIYVYGETPSDRNQLESRNIISDNDNLQLFDLSPAIQEFKQQGNKTFVDDSKNTWVIMDRIPCWELPFMYGEIKERFKGAYASQNVFGLYASTMQNVKYQTSEKEPSKGYPKTGYQNKWCSMAPCFGDHVLCLFPKRNQYSTICGLNYTAEAPTPIERIAITNEINSIRNHIARGSPDQYPFLPPAANMQQILYDRDLEIMTLRWLNQCLPGPAPCTSLELNFVQQLECTKFSDKCCVAKISPIFLGENKNKKCTPHVDCYVNPFVGCIHTWFKTNITGELNEDDVKCGLIKKNTYHFAQLIWAETNKVGCAYGRRDNTGDVRVICSFSPGVPVFIETDYFCGLLPYDNFNNELDTANLYDITSLEYLEDNGFYLRKVNQQLRNRNLSSPRLSTIPRNKLPFHRGNNWGVPGMREVYKQHWTQEFHRWFNTSVTWSMSARLATRFTFREETHARCDLDRPIYMVGPPGSNCERNGEKFFALCYDYMDSSTDYRVVAVLAPMVLFAFILFDLLNGVVRQTTS